MYKVKRVRLWLQLLLAICLCGALAFAQVSPGGGNNGTTIGNGNGNGACKNGPNGIGLFSPAGTGNAQCMEAARQELAVRVAARVQVDPQFKAFVDAVNRYNAAMVLFVQSKKGKK